MNSPDDVLRWCRSQLGTIESGGPHGNDGNIVVYWPEIGLPQYEGQPWCDAFASAAFLINHVPVPVMTFCPASEAWYKAHGRLWGPSAAQPGDQGFASWASGGIAPGHTWIVEENFPLTRTMLTIEGNTQRTSAGDQSNGGGVYERIRTYAECRSVGRPPYELQHPSLVPPTQTPVFNRFTLDGVPTVQMMVSLPTDDQGNGWLPTIQSIDVKKMVNVAPQGSAPARDRRYFPGSGHWQDDGGHPLVSVTGCVPNTFINAFVVYGE